MPLGKLKGEPVGLLGLAEHNVIEVKVRRLDLESTLRLIDYIDSWVVGSRGELRLQTHHLKQNAGKRGRPARSFMISF